MSLPLVLPLIACFMPQGVELASVMPSAWQTQIVQAAQKAGYTVVSAKRGKSLVGFIALELKHADGPTLAMKLVEGFSSIPAEADLTLVVETPYTLDQAKARAAELSKKFPRYEIIATMPAAGSTTARLSLRLIEKNTADPAAVVAGLDGLRQVGREAIVAELDPTLERLKEARLSYTDTGSFYKLKYNYSDTKRSQTAYIRKEVYTYNSLKVQEIFSLSYDKPEAPSPELLQSVFQKRFSIGGLVLEAPSEKQPNWRIRFRVTLTTSALPETLKQYLLLAAGTADNIEKELNPAEDKL